MRKRSCRFLRISLRGFLLLVLLAGMASGWIGVKRVQSERQSKAVAELTELMLREPNGRIDFRYHYEDVIIYDSGPARERSPRGEWLPGWLRRLTGEECFHRVVAVNLSGLKITEKDLSPLKTLNDVESLNFDGTPVGDKATPYLSHLKRLRHLCLGESQIGEQGLRELQSLTTLRELELWHNELTDDMLRPLKSMTHLKRINLCRTRVTSDGIAELEESLPDCRIWWDGTKAFQLINACPHPLGWDNPNPAIIVQTVNHLFRLGKDEAVESLREYIRIAPQMDFERFSYDQQRLCVLLPLLFDRTTPGQQIPEPPETARFYGNLAGQPTTAEWPTFYFSVEDNIPFHDTVFGGRSGPPDPARSYLVEWAAENCRFRPQLLHPGDDPLAAAEGLIERLAHNDCWLRNHLETQAQRMISHLDPGDGKPIKTRWNDELQQYVEQ